MRVKRFILPTLTMVIIASQLMGCAATSQSELLKMLNEGQQIEIEIAVPAFAEQGEEQAISWTQLDQLTTYSDFRGQMDDLMKISPFGEGSKTGIAYINLQGQQEGNNTLYNSMLNRKFIANFYENDSVYLNLQQYVPSLYADVEENDVLPAAINAYWNLLPDSTPNYFNGGATLTRLEAMSLLARATTPVTEEFGDEAFNSAVGGGDYADFASLVADDSYLDTDSKSLDNLTANGTITRGEYVYMLVSNIFGQDRMASADIKTASFSDCKDGGDIATAQKFIENGTAKDMYQSYELTYALQNPDDGCPTKMYRALATAQELGFLSSETRWDEGLTKEEAIQLFCDALQSYVKLNGYPIDAVSGAGDGVVIEAPVIDEPAEQGNPDNGSDVTGSDNDNGMTDDEINADIVDDMSGIEQSESEFEIIHFDDVTMYCTSNSANIRKGPNTSYDKVGSLAYAQEITVNGKVESDGSTWYVIKTDNSDDIQMVSGSLLSTTKPVQQSKPSGGGNGGSGSGGSGNGGQTQQPFGGGGQSSGGLDTDGGGAPMVDEGWSPAGEWDPSWGGLH